MPIETKYAAAGYVRLSKEDYDSGIGLKAESNSITNQKRLILDYVEAHSDIELVSMREDDGFTGTDYDRPDFQKMMDDVRAGVINCVIVKDLSRFGREYINAGKYIDKLFPCYGVRLIAINDNIDTVTRSTSDDFNIMIRNLMNDNYCRDISVKVRSQLQVKRKKGEYIGAFTPYGYKKSESDKNKLEIDVYPAQVVQDIFSWKLNGYSQNAICKKLMENGILSPYEYKRSQGERFKTSFKTGRQAQWTPVAVRRILTNPVYIGSLVQGVRSRPNYKIKSVVYNAPEEWVVVEDSHEAIITHREFELVQRLMGLDTRTSPREERVFPLAGLIECSRCHSPMIRKTTTSKGKRFVYYVCSSQKNGQGCQGVRIPEHILEDSVLGVLQEHIKTALELDDCLERMKQASFQSVNVRKLEERLVMLEGQLDRYRRLKVSAYEDYKDGLLIKDDYQDIRDQYDQKIQDAIRLDEQVRREIALYQSGAASPARWVQELMKYRSLTTLTRSAAAECIERVVVWDKGTIEVDFMHAQDFAALWDQANEYAQREGERKIG